jgi:hypothetical protein
VWRRLPAASAASHPGVDGGDTGVDSNCDVILETRHCTGFAYRRTPLANILHQLRDCQLERMPDRLKRSQANLFAPQFQIGDIVFIDSRLFR